jgi:hemin uptake protein HemP
MTPLDPELKAEQADEGKVPTVSSHDLLAGRRLLIIQHGEQQYRLRLTNSNKLILTK